jgi:hypothetical protein
MRGIFFTKNFDIIKEKEIGKYDHITQVINQKVEKKFPRTKSCGTAANKV